MRDSSKSKPFTRKGSNKLVTEENNAFAKKNSLKNSSINSTIHKNMIFPDSKVKNSDKNILQKQVSKFSPKNVKSKSLSESKKN